MFGSRDLLKCSQPESKPVKVLSNENNGTNFVGVAKQMKDCINAWNQSVAQKEFPARQLNPLAVPHFGGLGNGWLEIS